MRLKRNKQEHASYERKKQNSEERIMSTYLIFFLSGIPFFLPKYASRHVYCTYIPHLRNSKHICIIHNTHIVPRKQTMYNVLYELIRSSSTHVQACTYI